MWQALAVVPLLLVNSLMAADSTDVLGDPLPSGATQRLGTLRMRTGSVGGLAYLPDGRGAVLSGGNVDLWNLTEGRRESSHKVSSSPLTSVQLRQDGKALLLGDSAGAVFEWSPEALRELRSWQTGQQQLRTACYSPDGKRMLTAANTAPHLKEWDLETGRELIAITSKMVSIRAGAIYGPGGETAILGGGYTHNLERYDLKTGDLLMEWCRIYEAKHMALSPDEKSLTLGVEDRALEWSLETYQVLRNYKHCPGEAARIFQVAYLPDTDEVLCGGRDGSIHRWSRDTGELALSWRPHQSVVAPFAVSPDGEWVLSYGTYRLAETSIATGEPRVKWDRHQGNVECVEFLPSGQQAVTGSSDETLRLWDVAAGRTLKVLTGAKLGAVCLSVSPDGSRVAAGCKDGLVREWDLERGTLTRELTGHLGHVRAVRYDPSGASLHTCADDGSIRAWPVDAAQPPRVLTGHRGGVLGLAVSPDGRRLLSCGRDGTVRLWDAVSGAQVRMVDPAAGWLSCVAFAPDGEHALVGGRDGRIRKINLADGQCVLEIPHGSWVYTLACSADGAHLFSGGGDGRLMVWDASSGQHAEALKCGSPVIALSVHVAGAAAITNAEDTTALVWRIPSTRE